MEASQSIPWTQLPLMSTLVIVSVLIVMFFLKEFVSIFPSLIACTIRSKESINLEESSLLRRQRNKVFMVTIMPYALLCSRYRLWCPGIIDSFSELSTFLITFAALAIYFFIRTVLGRIFRPAMAPKVWSAGEGLAHTLFILISVCSALCCAIMLVLGCPDTDILFAMYCVAGFFTFLLLLRRFQILLSFSSLIQAFLYLCILEILPVAIVVAPAVFL